jgi:hypothetical protein
MGFMSNIQQQFLVQHWTWMPGVNFPEENTGQADLFGPSPLPAAQPQATQWTWRSDAGEVKIDFPSPALVRPMGGDYFYVPSLDWLAVQLP